MIFAVEDEEFEEVVNTSLSYAEMLRRFKVRPSSSNYRALKKAIKCRGIALSEYIGRRSSSRRGRPRSLEEILVLDGPYAQTRDLKARLIRAGLLEDRCSICHLGSEWEGKPLSLHLDHINGNHRDNRLENLRILCPNCHAQTPTYCVKNSHPPRELVPWKGGYLSRGQTAECLDCGNVIRRNCKRCVPCHLAYQAKRRDIEKKTPWHLAGEPSLEKLLDSVYRLGYAGTGRECGVAGSTVKKWIRRLQAKAA